MMVQVSVTKTEDNQHGMITSLPTKSQRRRSCSCLSGRWSLGWIWIRPLSIRAVIISCTSSLRVERANRWSVILLLAKFWWNGRNRSVYSIHWSTTGCVRWWLCCSCSSSCCSGCCCVFWWWHPYTADQHNLGLLRAAAAATLDCCCGGWPSSVQPVFLKLRTWAWSMRKLKQRWLKINKGNRNGIAVSFHRTIQLSLGYRILDRPDQVKIVQL